MKTLYAAEWPSVRGNVYLTGNNDDLPVRGNEILWTFAASSDLYNPIPSDKAVFFTDIDAFLYAVRLQDGGLLWKRDMKKTAARFRTLSRAAGKVKHPLLFQNTVIITDPVAMYAFDASDGALLWSETGLSGHSGRIVGGIYADPVLARRMLLYGTRNVFMARSIEDGTLIWQNNDVFTYSGFPNVMGNIIMTTSTEFKRKGFFLCGIDITNGKTLWKTKIPRPLKIFSPLIEGDYGYLPANQSIYAVHRFNGRRLWTKTYHGIITSDLSFSGHRLFFSIDNKSVLVVRSKDGVVVASRDFPSLSSPKFTLIRDYIYIGYTVHSGAGHGQGYIATMDLSLDKMYWKLRLPEEGAVGQPSAGYGALLVPAGRRLYAIGRRADFPLIAETNTGNTSGSLQSITVRTRDKRTGKPVAGNLEIAGVQNGRIIYSAATDSSGTATLQIPRRISDRRLIVSADGYVPQVRRLADRPADVTMDMIPLSKGGAYIIGPIRFETGRAHLKPEAIPILERIRWILLRNPDLKLEIRGHTDQTGTQKRNRQLSVRRAEAVAEYLIKNGIDADRLTARGFGSSQPVASNGTPGGRERNRRTEFIFH